MLDDFGVVLLHFHQKVDGLDRGFKESGVLRAVQSDGQVFGVDVLQSILEVGIVRDNQRLEVQARVQNLISLLVDLGDRVVQLVQNALQVGRGELQLRVFVDADHDDALDEEDVVQQLFFEVRVVTLVQTYVQKVKELEEILLQVLGRNNLEHGHHRREDDFHQMQILGVVDIKDERAHYGIDVVLDLESAVGGQVFEVLQEVFENEHKTGFNFYYQFFVISLEKGRVLRLQEQRSKLIHALNEVLLNEEHAGVERGYLHKHLGRLLLDDKVFCLEEVDQPEEG